ncbi:MAG: hypothetical protein RLZZ337_878 [Bacteroidota bacterium]|jgi:hypothetical protein
MVKIESEKAIINKSNVEVYDYLAVPANYAILMPSKVRSFSYDERSADLDIEGLGKIELAFTKTEKPVLIEMKPQNKVPFDFVIQWNVIEISETTAEVQAVINADLNFMMRMMAEKLLSDFLNIQVHKLKEHLNSK